MADKFSAFSAVFVGFGLCLVNSNYALNEFNHASYANNDLGSIDKSNESTESEIYKPKDYKDIDFNMAAYAIAYNLEPRRTEPKFPFGGEIMKYKQTTNDLRFLPQNNEIHTFTTKRKHRDAPYNISEADKTRKEKRPCYKHGRCSYKEKHNEKLLFQETNPFISGKLARNPRDVDVNVSYSNNTTKDRKTRAEKYPCYKYGRCSYNKLRYPPNCYCDDACVIYNDCCHDADDSFNISSNLNFQKTEYLYNFSSCEAIKSVLETLDGQYRGFYMINQCPPNFSDKDIEEKCSLSKYSKSPVPVPVTDVDGFTYRNAFCARCHGVTNFTYWELNFSCLKMVDMELDDKLMSLKNKFRKLLRECIMLFIPPKQSSTGSESLPRTCITMYKKRVQKNPSRRCDGYMNIIVNEESNEKFLIRNYNCLRKNYRNNGTFSCIRPRKALEMDFLPKDRNTSSTTYQFRSKYKKCHFGMDIKMDDTLVCVTEIIRGVHIKVDVVLQSTDTTSLDFFKRAMSVFYTTLPTETYQFKLYTADVKQNRANVICGKDELDTHKTCCECTMTLSFIVQADLERYQVINLVDKLSFRDFNYTESPEGRPHLDFASTLRIMFNSQFKGFTSPICRTPISSAKTFQEFIFDTSLINTSTAAINITNKYIIQTTISGMKRRNDIHVTINQTDRFAEPSKGILEMGQLFLKTTSLPLSKITAPFVTPSPFVHDITRDFISVYTFVKYFVMGISLLSLIITLILYIYLGDYTSLIGQICINIMSILILSNFVYLFGIEATDNKIVCSVIGAILHYTWTSSFTWVSVYALLVSQIISKFKVNLSFNSDIYFSKQSIYFVGYCFSLILVIPCVVMEIIQDSNLDIGYNVELCFLSVYPANIIFLSGPIILSVGVTFVILLILSQFKRKYDPKEIHVSSRICLEYINGFVVYCLGSFLLWILGISVQVFKNDIPGYVFTMVIGAHGPLFAICILCSKPVRNAFCVGSKIPPESDQCLESADDHGKQRSELTNECPKLCSESAKGVSGILHEHEFGECPKFCSESTNGVSGILQEREVGE